MVSQKVRGLLAALSVEQKLAQLLHPFIRTSAGLDSAKEFFDGVEIGAAFFFPGTRDQIAEISKNLQSDAKVPLLFSSDLENGAGRMVNDATVFPDLMALAATGREDWAYTMGKAAAREGRDCNIHWSFGPVVDLNVNPRNPITNTRSLGDDLGLVSRLSAAIIRGMQENGLAACAKHFPGDGLDDRDQHLATSINPLSRRDWKRLSGASFRNAIDTGVWSIMPGHIALPSFDPSGMPAVLSAPLLQGLLRGQLGFEGLIISDAIEMGGSTSLFQPAEAAVRAIIAGCDMILFCEPRRDFEALQKAYRDGRLSAARIDEACTRVLELKERLGLFQEPITPAAAIPSAERAEYRKAAVGIARSSLTEVRRDPDLEAAILSKDMKVLSVHLRGDEAYNVDRMDQLLKERGLDVTRISEKDSYDEVREPIRAGLDPYLRDARPGKGFDAVIVHLVFGPSWASNRIGLSGNFNRILSEIFKYHHRRQVLVSYGSPYHLYDYPRTSTLLNAYSPDPLTQDAVIDWLFGDLKAAGKSPVKIPSGGIDGFA